MHVTAILSVQMVQTMGNALPKKTYFNFKVYALIILEGYITAFEVLFDDMHKKEIRLMSLKPSNYKKN